MTLTTSSRTALPDAPAARLGLGAGVVAAVGFVLVDFADALLRPGYSPLRHWVSHRALGDLGWIGTVSLLAAAALLLAHGASLFAAARRAESRSGYATALVVAAVALLVAAVFPMDPSLGYPPATPQPDAPTLAGRVHDVAGPVFVLAMAVSAFLSPRFLRALGDSPQWARFGPAAGIAIALAFVLTAVLVSLDYAGVAWARWSGAAERLAIYLGLLWVASVARWLSRAESG